MRPFLVAVSGLLLCQAAALAQAINAPARPGTTAGTFAAGNDSRITGAVQAGALGTTPLTAVGASASTTLAQALSGSRFLVPRTPIGLWKPFGGNLASDTGSLFPTNKTAYVWMEVEGTPLAIQPIFANQSTSPFTVTDLAASGSSELAAPNYTGFTPGITPYDGSGTALTTMARGTFANAGANSEPFPPSFGSTCTTLTSNATGGQAVLNVASAAGIAANMVAVQQSAGANYIAPQTYVASIASLAVTLSGNVVNTMPSGAAVCFLPIGATVPAAPNPPIQALFRADWLPITPYARIDSPVVTGGLVTGPAGIPAGDTVAASTATQVTLASPTTADVPPGSKVGFCRATTVTNAYAPVTTVTFSSVPATVIAGMYASVQTGNFGQLIVPQSFPSGVTVTGTTGTTVTLSAPLNVSLNNTMLFYYPLTVAANAASGSNTLTVNSVPAGIASGMYLFGTGIAGAGGVAFNPGSTFTLSGTTLTLSANTVGQINAGDTVYAAVSLAGGTATVSNFAIGSSYGIYPGALVVGAGIAPNTYAVNPGGNFLTLSNGPTAALTAGQAINACDPLVTTADAPAGSTALTFKSTTYPKKLILLRVNFGSSNVQYYGPPSPAAQNVALWTGAVGGNRLDAGTCGAGVDGVLSVTAIGNGGGSCARALFFPLSGVKVQTAERGVVMVNIGDSHFAGDTTTLNGANMVARAAIALTSPSLPVWAPNLGRGGTISQVFAGGEALALVKELNPGVVAVAGYTWNDVNTAAGLANYLQEVAAVSKYVTGYGGLPVILTEYERQIYGCNAANVANDLLRQQANATMLRVANDNNLPILDVAALLLDPSHASSIAPAYSGDCIHANDNGHGVAGAALATTLRPYLAN